eukprot:3640498-Rhodomonas_salina.1
MSGVCGVRRHELREHEGRVQVLRDHPGQSPVPISPLGPARSGSPFWEVCHSQWWDASSPPAITRTKRRKLPAHTVTRVCAWCFQGKSDYAHQLALDFAVAIDGRYSLNDRYRRAFWINPGYEWTPTQTGGNSIFSLSQKLFLL